VSTARGAVSLRRGGRPAWEVDSDPDPGRWAAFVDAHPDASPFHTPQMHDVLARAPHHRPHVWAASDGDGRIHALLVTTEIAVVGGPLRLLTTRNVAFASPLVANDAGAGALDAVMGAFRRHRPRAPVFTEIRHHVDPSPQLSALESCGFQHERHLNFLVDLSRPEDELWAGLASSARRAVRRALKSGLRVEEAAGAEELAAGFAVLQDVYRRIRVPLPGRELFQAAQDLLGPSGRFRMLLARTPDGTVVGLVCLLQQGTTALYWYAGTLRGEYANLRVADLLAWEAIRRSREAGAQVFDFGGGGRPDEPYGVRDFKAKYGGRLVDFGRDVWTSAPARARVATTGYELVRRVRS
jgi:serine/alanine adding enzyme